MCLVLRYLWRIVQGCKVHFAYIKYKHKKKKTWRKTKPYYQNYQEQLKHESLTEAVVLALVFVDSLAT